MKLKGAVLGLFALLAIALPAHADAVFSASGGVLLPTVGFPNLTFGTLNACTPASPVQGVGGYSIEVPATTLGHSYTLTSDVARNDLDIVWLSRFCVGLGYDVGHQNGNVQTGTVPAKAFWAYVILYTGVNATFTFEVQ